jgi:hypothetical protein
MGCCSIATDRKEAGLRGLVRTCATEHDVVYPDRHWIMHTTDTFSQRGDLLERQHTNPDGSRWSVIRRYDECGILREEARLGDDLEDLYCYQYDELGRVERVIVRSAQHGERVFESYLYGHDGTKTQTSYPLPIIAKEGVFTLVASDGPLHMSPDAVAIMTLFDAMGRPIRKVLYNADDRIIHRVQFRYDERGLLIEEGELIGGGISADFRNLFRYDQSGRRIEDDRRWSSGGERRRFSYNEQGDVVEEQIDHFSDLTLNHPAHQSWAQRYSYEYDDQNNWIIQRTETAVDRRQLTYY